MRGLALVLLCATGCKQVFGLNDLPGDDEPPADTPTVDKDAPLDVPSEACQAVGTGCMSSEILATCTTIGEAPTQTTCPWGCEVDSDPARCSQLAPSASTATAADLTPDAALAPSITLDGAVINGTNGAITGSLTRDPGSGIDQGIRFEVRGNFAIFTFTKLIVSSNVTIRGTRPIVILATDSIELNGTIEGTSFCAIEGAGPGGALGGGGAIMGGGIGGGGPGVRVLDSSDGSGAGGGGSGTVGGAGGMNSTDQGGIAGIVSGDDLVTPLVGGAGGGGGGNSSGVSGGGPGGGGGAALQLAASNSIIVDAATGGINAGGCGGQGGSSSDGGGGGGLGGTILVEAATVTLKTGLFAVNGGGGGGADTGTDGENGLLSLSGRAAGGSGEAGVGGFGAGGGAPTGEAGENSSDGGGGGGGGLGRIRINTRSGAAVIDGVFGLSPNLSTNGSTTATQGTAAKL